MAVTGFLKKIKAVKEAEVEQILRHTSRQTLQLKAESFPKAPEFKKVLQQSGPGHPGIIAEIKKASPSKGDIHPDLDPVEFAQQYEKAGACAVSVLTEPVYFKGSLDDLATVCREITIPVLRKDFIISSLQIYEAKVHGAGAVLLINKLLEKDQLKDYIDLALDLDMTPLVEIHSEWELETILAAGTQVLGVNNRNLETLETDVAVSGRVGKLLTGDLIAIEASGISSARDVANGVEAGFYTFLVGESIVRSEDPAAFIRSLRNGS